VGEGDEDKREFRCTPVWSCIKKGGGEGRGNLSTRCGRKDEEGGKGGGGGGRG